MSPQLEDETDTMTKVTVRMTKLKVLPSEHSQVTTVKIVGRMTVIEARKMVREQYGQTALVVTKINEDETFNVSSLALLQLKEQE